MNTQKNNPNQRSLIWKTLQGASRIFTTLWFDLKVDGLENVPQTGAVLLLSNHQSYLDPVLVGVRLRRPVSFMARATLFRNPFFAGLIRRLEAFPVRLGEADVGAIKECIRRLEVGYALNVFPEGTRTLDGEVQPIEKGIALVIRKAAVPVIPVAIHGSFDAWPKGARIFRPHPIRVRFGKPMKLHEMKGDKIVTEIEEALRGLLQQLREPPARGSAGSNG
jgi:1-acyl-sn-glycerol-3-phosphate acyltransferase